MSRSRRPWFAVVAASLLLCLASSCSDTDEARPQIDKSPAERAARAKANLKKGEDFLAENKKKEGVKTTKSGLQYIVLKEGSGIKPYATDTVQVHYHGTLLDGSVFDSSVKRGEPATFPLNHVIPGWTEILQLMPKGSKWCVFIPPDLAYGQRGTPDGKIGPNETLVFEIELLDIQ